MSLSNQIKCQQQSKSCYLILDRLESIIKQCHNRFVNRYELATENDQLVIDLLQIIEEILSDGLLKNRSHNKIIERGNKLINNILSKTNYNDDDTDVNFWNFISFYLTEHELKRFLSLRNVQTDLGRCRSWIRNCLNEHSLEKYFLMFLESDQLEHRKQHYNDQALLLSLTQEQFDKLPSLFKSLNSILFALNIDIAELDVPPSTHESSSPSPIKVDDNLNIPNDSMIESLAPMRKNDGDNLLVKSTKKKSNLIIIEDNYDDDDDNEDNCDDDDDDEYESAKTSVTCQARSAPVTSFLTHSMNIKGLPQELSVIDDADLIEARRSTSLLSVNESEPSKLVFYPIPDDISPTQPPTTSSSSPTSANAITEDKSSKIDHSENLEEKINDLEKIRDRLSKENDSLNIQIKKYIATIELLKYNTYQQRQLKQSSSSSNENLNSTIDDYQKKLIQVSEMHGEIVEFNEHLYKVIQVKDSIITRLRNELIELRGPLPDQDETICISNELLESNTHSLQSLPQPLIHVWIPTAFLSGGFKGKSHHIYQIYVRIKDEEWNVYRRYSQFYNLYRSLKTKYPSTSKFEFPPKKAIGNKDSKVVQERRKKLENYLRNVINHIQLKHAEINNKETFVAILPFLSDKYFLQDHRTQSESNLNQQQPQQQQQSLHNQQRRQQQQRTNQRNYLGF